LAEIGWDDAVDEAERLLREARGRVVTALSGSETVEQAYALGRLMRAGLGSSSAVLPEMTSDALEAFRVPLSTIGDAELIVVLGDDPVVERAPIVDLWIRAARRKGAEVVTIGPLGTERAHPGTAAESCRRLAHEGNPVGDRIRNAGRAVVIWSGAGGQGGAHVALLGEKLGLAGKEGCGVFHLPATPNGRGVAEAWAAADDGETESPEPIGLLFVSGDEAAADPNVRALAEHAERVIATTMFQGLAVGWADLVLPGTSYLERDGSYVNLEGRVQRLRRAAIPPAPDELAWISRLAERFGVEVPPYPAAVFAEPAERLYDGMPFGEVGERAPLRAHVPPAPVSTPEEEPPPPSGEGLRLLRYRPLFSGAAVERVPELAFQRPRPEAELAHEDAQRLGISTGDDVVVASNGASQRLRARVTRELVAGVVRVAEPHAEGLAAHVEVRPGA
jgi:anaerobic selenocysteine-containing dehydrogenase